MPLQPLFHSYKGLVYDISRSKDWNQINLTDKIISKKTKDTPTDTTSLEHEIDKLVYKLYKLTYDEVKVVDPEFELTKKEYDTIKVE